MLTSLLPGVRELRTPFISGWLWLLAGWVLFGMPTDTLVHSDLGKGLAGLGVVPSSAWFAALSFVAFLSGAVADVDVMHHLRRGTYRRSPITYVISTRERWLRWHLRLFGFRGVSSSVMSRLLYRVSEQLTAPHEKSEQVPGQGTSPDCTNFSDADKLEVDTALGVTVSRYSAANREPDEAALRVFMPPSQGASCDNLRGAIWGVVRAVVLEVPDTAATLQRQDALLFDRYDRLASEVKLRFAMAAPILVLSAGLVWRAHWTWLALVPIAAALVVQGLYRSQNANDVIVDAVATGLIKSVVLERVRAQLYRAPLPNYLGDAPRPRHAKAGRAGALSGSSLDRVDLG